MSSIEQNEQQNEQSVAQRKQLPDLTPYAASVVVTALLARAGVDVKVSSQAMYSRAMKNVIESYRVNGSSGKWMLKGDAFAKWAKRYVDSYVNGTVSSAKTDYEALADQYGA